MRPAAFDKPLYQWGEVSGRTLVIWGSAHELERPYLRKAFERYRKLTGNKVRLMGFTHQELERRTTAAFVSGTLEKPDILLSYGGTNIEKLNPDANFYDFSHAPWVDDLTDTAINQTICNGRVVGLPHWEASVSGTLYNKDLFKKFDIALPGSQKEFFAVCETLLRHGITPLYLPYAEESMLLYQFPLDSVVSDERVLEKLNGGLLSYAQLPEVKTIVQWYKIMSDRGYFGPRYVRNNWTGMDEAMRSGKYAMMLCWDTWLYTHFTGDASRFGLMPAFMGVPEKGTFEGPNLMLLLVSRHSSQLDAALDLITFMADPYNYNVAFEGLYTAPVFKNQAGSLTTPQYTEAENRIEALRHDSVAWLRIRGFSQLDAVYIRKHMRDPAYSVEDCLRDLDAARIGRTTANN